MSSRFGTAVGTDIDLDGKGLPSGDADFLRADRATCFRDGVFDLVVFNPPYLPSGAIEDRAVDGGRGGVDVPLSFLEEASRVVSDDGAILALLSEEGDVPGFIARAEGRGMKVREVAARRLFYERLVVLEMRR